MANEDINDDSFVGRILTRREILGLLGTTGLTVLAGCGGGSGAVSKTGANTTNTTSTGTTSTTSTSSPSTGSTSATSTGTITSGGSTGSTGSGTTPNIMATPAETEGPFYINENLSRSNLVGDTNRLSVVTGLPLALGFTVFQISKGTLVPLSGAHFDVWHADSIGTYSDEVNGPNQSENTRGQVWLRGYQVTDANGSVGFTTIYPGWYEGRAIHLHFKIRVYAPSGSQAYEFTSQLFFDDTISDAVMANAPYNTRGTRPVRNGTDSVYNTPASDGSKSGPHLMLSPTKTSTGYAATFVVALQMS